MERPEKRIEISNLDAHRGRVWRAYNDRCEPRGKMFVDWCPMPRKVVCIQPGERVIRSYVVPPQPAPRWGQPMPDRAEYSTIDTRLRLVPDGAGDVSAYGWEPESRTVYISRVTK